ncbi:hypothetical protein V8F33_005735 [Rhypophila sp. PSN 637]
MGPLRNQHAGVLKFVLLLLLNTVHIIAESTSTLEDEHSSHPWALEGLPDCAVKCVINSAQQSGCSLIRGVDCLCLDGNLDTHVATCLETCPEPEKDETKSLAAGLCVASITADDEIVPIFAVFITLTLVAVSLRVVARVLTKAYFWWDDLFNLFALGGCMAFTTITIMQVDYGFGMDVSWVKHKNIALVLQLFYFEIVLYTMTRFFIRASIILFYLRVFPAQLGTNIRPWIIWTMVFNIAYEVAYLFAGLLLCQPISYFWTRWPGPAVDDGYCGDLTALAWVAASTGILFDFWLLALPIWQLVSLNAHWKQKALGCIMVAVGVSVVVISMIRLKTIHEFSRVGNPTKDIMGACLWSGIELDVGVICPCLFSWRLLLRRWWPRLVGITDDSRNQKRSGSDTAGTQSPVGGFVMRRRSTLTSLTSLLSMSRKGSGKWSGDCYNSRGNIIKTTEVGVDFETVSPTTVATHGGGGGSISSVSSVSQSDGESINQSHNGHDRMNGAGRVHNDETSLV